MRCIRFDTSLILRFYLRIQRICVLIKNLPNTKISFLGETHSTDIAWQRLDCKIDISNYVYKKIKLLNDTPVLKYYENIKTFFLSLLFFSLAANLFISLGKSVRIPHSQRLCAMKYASCINKPIVVKITSINLMFSTIIN